MAENKKYLMYDCQMVELHPPKNFLKRNIIVDDEVYKNSVYVDECLSTEIEILWSQGIKTTGCCCGHGCNLGYIQVTDECIGMMEELGYQHYLYIDKINDGTRMDAFIPQTTHHRTTKTIPYKWDLENNILKEV